MPTVSVFEDELCESLNEKFTPDTFQDLCFQFGLELDDVTSEYEMVRKEQGEAAAAGKSKRVIYRVDIPANRYDLLCVEGLVMALKVFKKKMALPKFTCQPAKPTATMNVTATCTKYRPFVVCAILRDLEFNEANYQSFIDLQDKLHQNICRRRQLASVGTHDLDTIQGPFTFDCQKPEDIVFKPLKAQITVDAMAVGLVVSKLGETKKLGAISKIDKENKTCVVGKETHAADKNGNFQLEIFEINSKDLMKFYSVHQQLKAYVPIINHFDRHPVIRDKNGTVLSLPPIINGDHSKISLNTKNVFIEVTATDLTKAKIVLNTLIAMFSGYCKKQYTCEPVEVIYDKKWGSQGTTHGGQDLGGKTLVLPDLTERSMMTNATRLKTDLNLPKLTTDDVKGLLEQMALRSDKKGNDELNVFVPVTRSDVMHECDLVEDVAIAHGYMNLTHQVPQVVCPGQEYGLNHFSDLVRGELANAGFCEALNFGLLSKKDNFVKMRREQGKQAAKTSHAYDFAPVPVCLSNPKTKEFEIVRTALLPGLMNTLFNNKKNPPPIKLFEVSDVCVQDHAKETFSRNVRRACCVYAGLTSGFETVHGALDHILGKFKSKPKFAVEEAKKEAQKILASAQAAKKAAGKDKAKLKEAEDAEAAAQKILKTTEKDMALAFSLEPLPEGLDKAFLTGRSAKVVVKGLTIGVIGVIHPEVSEAFELPFACSAFEINLEPFLEWLTEA